MTIDVLVVGGGILGLAVGYKLLCVQPGLRVSVLEKEHAVGQHQSGRNSGVLHAGLAYVPGSLKARLAVTGIREMVAFCQEHGIAFERCGKLVIAADEAERARLEQLMQRGGANGLVGLRWLEGSELRHVEPHVGGIAGLHVPEEGIVNFGAVCQALVGEIVAREGRVMTDACVTNLTRRGSHWVAATTAGEVTAQALVNCAGLHSDEIARLAGERPSVRLVPFRGEYYTLRAERAHLVRHLIYPTPDPRFPFLGVHFTRRLHGGIAVGPNAVLALAREGYRRSQVDLGDVARLALLPGWWRFVARHPKMCLHELGTSLSRHAFARALQRLVPAVRPDDLEPAGAGVRAQAMTPDGRLVDDFLIVGRPGAVHVLNAPSPAATASLSIAEEIVRRYAGAVGLARLPVARRHV